MSGQQELGLYRYRLRLKRPIWFAGHRLEERQGLLVQQGRGWGDVAPLPGFSDEDLATAESDARAALEQIAAGRTPAPRCASVRFGLDCAARSWPLPAVASGTACALLVGSAERLLQTATTWMSGLPGRVKLKVAREDPAVELELVRAIRAGRPEVDVVLDANGRWDRDEALSFCRALGPAQALYVEDPCEDLADIEAVARATGVAVALDAWMGTGRPWTAFEGLHSVVFKPTLIGALADCERIVARAGAMGVQVVLSSSFESEVGVRHLAQLAAHWAPDVPAGLDTLRYFDDAVLDVDGEPDRSKLDRLWP